MTKTKITLQILQNIKAIFRYPIHLRNRPTLPKFLCRSPLYRLKSDFSLIHEVIRQIIITIQISRFLILSCRCVCSQYNEIIFQIARLHAHREEFLEVTSAIQRHF